LEVFLWLLIVDCWIEEGMAQIPKSDMKVNAIRSGIVVLGALAFGYLSFRIGFKPYLEKAQVQQQQQNEVQQSHDSDSDPSSDFKESISFPERG